jgi:hypothetical protein
MKSLTLFSLSLCGSVAHASPEVVYRVTRTFDERGGFTERTEGSPVVTLQDGTRFSVGEDALEAPDGSAFSLAYTAGQAEEDAPLVATFEVVREPRRLRSRDERLQDWWGEHPQGSDEERAGYEAALDAAPMVVSERTVQGALLARLARAADDELVEVTVRLGDAPPMQIPSAAPWLADTDPAAALALWEERILAIEDRRTELATVQEGVRTDLEARGARVVHGHWMVNVLDLLVPARVARELVDDPRFLRVQLTPRPTGDGTWGNEVRVAMQTKQYADAGYNGSEPSGKNTYSDMFAVVIDNCIDEDHPVWKTSASGASRLQHVYRYSGGWGAIDPAATDSCISTDGAAFHGQRVAAIYLADLLDGQDPAITSVTERRKRTGMTTEAVFDFIESDGGVGTYEFAGSLSPDVVNRSQSYCEESNDTSQPKCLNYCDVDDTATTRSTPCICSTRWW